MSVREGAEMGMQPLDVAQSGARTAPGCRHRKQNLLSVFCSPRDLLEADVTIPLNRGLR